MFSGNNTVEYPTQWALNPGAYQNVSNEQVDWAALAQQWIQMKESSPATPSTPASSTASLSSSQPSSQPSQTSQPSQPSPALLPVAVGEEGGEAPMEVEGNESDIPPAPIVSPQQWKSANDSSSWGNSWEQWGNSNRPIWEWQSNSSSKNSQLPGDAPCVGTYSANDSNYSGYGSGNQPNYRPGYWSTDDTAETSTGNVPLNDNLEGSRGARRAFRQPLHTTAPEVDTTQTIDAAKRRQLPAWIREGLEKMEREKQKQVEREKDKKDREEFLKHKKFEEEQTPPTKTDDSIPKMPTKSKFDTDSDNSDVEDKNSKTRKDPPRERVAAPPPIIRSKEEIMQEIMLCVRRSLTEILLEVTNEQILSVCQEELSRKRSQPQATHGASMASKSQALSSIGGQLGLGIYENSSGDSNSENESEDGRRSSTPGEKRRKAADISDGQLQDSIKRRKAEFEKTTREIEAQIALDEMGNNKNDHKASTTGDRSSRGARGMGDSESDGEDSTTHIRNEQNNIKQKKNLEGTPPLDSIKKSLTDANAEKFARASKSRHSEGGNKSLDTNHKDRSSGKFDKYSSKRDKNDKYKKRKSSKNEFRDESSARSTDSDSESDSSTKKSDYSGGKRSASTSDSSSNSSSNSSYTSDSSVRNSKKHKKKESSEDSNRSKRSKKDKTKSKDKKDKRNKHSKRSVKSSYASNSKTDNSESHSKKQSSDYKEDHSSRDSSVRKSYTRTPERKSYKSRYSERSRSRSDDRRSHHTHDSHDRYYGSYSRDKYKMKDRRDRSRDDRERLRDDKDWHRDDRGRSRDRKERRDRDKRSDREYRNSRSSRY